jgi:hypothetical protein
METWLDWAIYFVVLASMVIYIRAARVGNNPTLWALGFVCLAVIGFVLGGCSGPFGAFVISFKLAGCRRVRPEDPAGTARAESDEQPDAAGQ